MLTTGDGTNEDAACPRCTTGIVCMTHLLHTPRLLGRWIAVRMSESAGINLGEGFCAGQGKVGAVQVGCGSSSRQVRMENHRCI